MRTVGFTASDIASKEAKTNPAVEIGRVVIDDIDRTIEENGGENAAPPEKPKGGRPRKPKDKTAEPETVPPDETDDGTDAEPVTDENGEADEADSNG